MRIISQCGTMDLPYELIALSTGNNWNKSENYIFVHSTIFGTDKGTIVARYSTEEKAKDAMSYLHGCYNEYIYDKYGRNSVDATFRFPADDEI